MKIFSLLVALFILCGCQTSAPHGARLTRAQAINIAGQVAAEHNQRLQDYLRPEVRFDSQTGKWEVSFQQKDNLRAFVVVIDDETGVGTFLWVNVAIPSSSSCLPPNTALEPTPTAP